MLADDGMMKEVLLPGQPPPEIRAAGCTLTIGACGLTSHGHA